MILIADSGSTKTDWRLINKEEKISFETIGFNPYFINSDKILNELINSELAIIKTKITQVYFYAAGCATQENKNVLEKSLALFFINAKIEVEHDMLAAARATCGSSDGIVAILGTGSNSCLYNGEEITENVRALGFILGDYGSGADIGKAFIKAFLGGEIPSEIEGEFKRKYNLDTDSILASVYKEALPNRFLASFSVFVSQHINTPIIRKLVVQRFNLFFEKNICRYTNYQEYNLNLVGSVAFFYQDLIKEVAAKYEVKIGQIIKKPIVGLVQFHK